MTTVIMCDFCDTRCEYHDNPTYHAARAEVLKHEQQCSKNPLVQKIEQLQDVLAQIITKAGDVDRDNWPAVQQEIQGMARKALEGK